ncbi:MAG: phytanoyl-CoA dioxygenase family protein [Pseudomonadota bacterium]
MAHLSQTQIDTFSRDGAIVVEDAISPEALAALQSVFAGWVEDSRQNSTAYGTICDGRPRFDLERDHTPDKPALRRVASPNDISPEYAQVAFDSAIVDMAADLIGPDVRFHHAKVNSKLPHSTTVVKWHQDFPFDPHSNDDTLTALLFLDDVTMENGPLMIAPGSHQGPLHSLWQDGIFTGAVAAPVAEQFAQVARPCTGPAGAVCLMHSRVAHASSANTSEAARTLYIVTYAAADAARLSPVAVPSPDCGRIVRGRDPGRIRSIAFDVEMPEIPTGASFFEQQAGRIAT